MTAHYGYPFVTTTILYKHCLVNLIGQLICTKYYKCIMKKSTSKYLRCSHNIVLDVFMLTKETKKGIGVSAV